MTADPPIPGAFVQLPPDMTADGFDELHADAARSPLLARLSKEAFGNDFPDDVDPYGSSSTWTLDTLLAVLELRPSERLVDIGCGRAGVSLWLARESGASLVGVDFSPVGIEGARRRADDWVEPGRAVFHVGDLVRTGLPDGSADAVVCADAIFFAADRIAAVREVARILRPGGRYAFTADENTGHSATAVPDWAPIIRAGGLEVVERIENTRWREQLERMYAVWMSSLDEVRTTLGDQAANDLREEAESVGPTLATRTGVLYLARRPS